MTAERSLFPQGGFDRLEHLAYIGHASCLCLGKNSIAVDVDVQCTRHARAEFHGDPGLLFDVLFQAHGLGLDVLSEEAALDGDFH